MKKERYSIYELYDKMAKKALNDAKQNLQDILTQKQLKQLKIKGFFLIEWCNFVERGAKIDIRLYNEKENTIESFKKTNEFWAFEDLIDCTTGKTVMKICFIIELPKEQVK